MSRQKAMARRIPSRSFSGNWSSSTLAKARQQAKQFGPVVEFQFARPRQDCAEWLGPRHPPEPSETITL